MTSDGSKTYLWDAENRLVEVKQGGNTLATFAYDGMGRRVEKAAAGVTHRYVHDGVHEAEERLSGVATGTMRYVVGRDIDDWLGRQNVDSSTTYFSADHLGSITNETSTTGAVTLARTYDAWGNLDAASATVGGPAFTGRAWEPEAGLYYYRARHYDSQMGRFASADPIGFRAGVNFYAYALADPVNLVDPMGLDVQLCHRQMHNMVEGVSHSVIYPTSTKASTGPGTGKCIASGFGPKKGIGWQGGAVYDEEICDEYGNYHPAYSCVTVSTDDCIEECVKEKVANDRKNPPPYRPGPRWAGGNQCTDWTEDMMTVCRTKCASKATGRDGGKRQ